MIYVGWWAVPGTLLLCWMVYPATTPDFKRSLGLLPPLEEEE